MTKKMYKIVPTKKQLEILKLYWKMFKAEESLFWGKIGEVEKAMSKKAGIKGLEFYHDTMCSGWVGIGQYDRNMRLIMEGELE